MEAFEFRKFLDAGAAVGCPHVEDDDFAADGINYYEIDVVQMELYTDKKDLDLEHRVQQILTNHDIYYERDEVWIPEERLYEVIYYFEMEAS